MNKLFDTDLRSKLSKYANERVAAFRSIGGEYITVILEDGYKFADVDMQETTFRTIKELKEVTKKSNIVEVGKEAPNKKLKDGTLVMSYEEWRAIRKHCKELRNQLGKKF